MCTGNKRKQDQLLIITIMREVTIHNWAQMHVLAISGLKAHTHTCSQHFTLRREKRKPVSKRSCGAGDWGEFKGHVRETEGICEGWGGVGDMEDCLWASLGYSKETLNKDTS